MNTDNQQPSESAPKRKLPNAKPQLYAYYFEQLKEIAREYGYNLVIHGSMNRDCDLIAIPWVDNPKDEFDMINAFSKILTGYTTERQYREQVYLFKVLPGFRNAYVINLNRGGYKAEEDENGIPIYVPDPEYYIDISITPHSKLPASDTGSLSVEDRWRVAEWISKQWPDPDKHSLALGALKGIEYEHRHMAAKQAELIAENTRLQSELLMHQGDLALSPNLAALQSENARLQEALEAINCLKWHSNSGIIIRRTFEIVDAALTTTPKPHE